jgi:hypothetical protein
MIEFQVIVPGIWGENARIDMEHLKKTVAELLKSLGEVPPVALLENVSGVTSIPIIYRNNAEKRFFFHVFLPALIRATGTTKLGIVQEVWFYRTEEKLPENRLLPASKHPDREEAVHILILTDRDMKSVMMTIRRDENNRPAIGEVYEAEVFVPALQKECIKALKDVAKEISR